MTGYHRSLLLSAVSVEHSAAVVDDIKTSTTGMYCNAKKKLSTCPNAHEFARWFFDITLIIWAIIGLYEQFKMGYNPQNKP